MDSVRRIKPFEMVADRSKLPTEWQKWKRELERYFDATGVFTQWEKRSMLLHLAGPDIQEIFDHLPGVDDIPQVLIDPPYYEVALKKLDEHFEPMRRKNYERHLFRQILQKSDERFADFVLRLRIQAKRCEFDKYDAREVNDRIIEQIVEGCKSTELRRNILAKDLSLEDIVTLGTTLADVQDQMKQLDRNQSEGKPTGSFNHGVNKVFRSGPSTKWRSGGQHNKATYSWVNPTKTTDRNCFACGYRGHLKGDPLCRAKSAKCLKCGQIGHFINRCLKRTNSMDVAMPKPKRIRLVDNEEDPKEDNIFFAMGKNAFEFIVGGVKIPMIIDSGAAANLIDKATWKRVQKAGIVIKDYSSKADRKLFAYATDLPMEIRGMFTAEIQAGPRKVDATFYIIEQGKSNLLGDSTAKQLKVLRVGFDIGSFQASSKREFPKIKGVLVEIPIDTKVQPVQQAYRRAPISLEERIFEKLQYLLDRDIIEKVEGPSPWVSPLVPVLKESGDVRLCVDMRQANRGVLREYHPFPLIEELLGSVNGAVRFSRVDVKDAYHQLELSEGSRVITTFITKYGLFRYKRLMFGISCAPEIFQKVMDTILAGLEGVIVYLDDVMVHGKTQEEHDRRLAALLNRLDEYGVLLNKDKCLFNVDSLEFLGHLLTTEGIKPTDNRVSAIKTFREPRNVSELRSFLGLITYVVCNGALRVPKPVEVLQEAAMA
ncbi:uncharacterized protein K02A2.6-like [Armigeres subalbatus]|uniref:uncharacterized protein K02A2.6-like n=1 Tax=Armigeres subalbatus TaxID=124917 RepID=UPI002ED1D9F7